MFRWDIRTAREASKAPISDLEERIAEVTAAAADLALWVAETLAGIIAAGSAFLRGIDPTNAISHRLLCVRAALKASALEDQVLFLAGCVHQSTFHC